MLHVNWHLLVLITFLRTMLRSAPIVTSLKWPPVRSEAGIMTNFSSEHGCTATWMDSKRTLHELSSMLDWLSCADKAD